MKAIYLPLFFSGFRDFLNHPSRLAASGANLFFFVRLCFAISILCASAQFYFMRFGAIIIVCALTRLLFYARQRNFMPRQFSSLTGFYPDRGGVEARGRLRACSQRLSRHFNTIAPLGAEDWQ